MLGTQANFNGFRVLASLLHRRRSTEVNHALYNVWPSPGLVHYLGALYIFGGSCPIMELCQVQNSLFVQSCVNLYWQRGCQRYCTTLEQWASAKLRRSRPIFARQSGHPVRHWALELSNFVLILCYLYLLSKVCMVVFCFIWFSFSLVV